MGWWAECVGHGPNLGTVCGREGWKGNRAEGVEEDRVGEVGALGSFSRFRWRSPAHGGRARRIGFLPSYRIFLVTLLEYFPESLPPPFPLSVLAVGLLSFLWNSVTFINSTQCFRIPRPRNRLEMFRFKSLVTS